MHTGSKTNPWQSRSRSTTEPQDDRARADEEDPPEKGPLRRCIVSREQGRREMMLRFVVGPNGAIVPDLAVRLPGRGIWLSARADVIHHSRLAQAFSRAARTRVDLPNDLAARVQTGLRQRIGDLIGFARRAGEAVAGYQKAHEWLIAGRAALIVQAGDGSAEERVRFMGGRDVAVVAPLSARALGTIFGRDEAVHVAVATGRLAGLLKIEAARLDGVAGGGVAGETGMQSGGMAGSIPAAFETGIEDGK